MSNESLAGKNISISDSLESAESPKQSQDTGGVDKLTLLTARLIDEEKQKLTSVSRQKQEQKSDETDNLSRESLLSALDDDSVNHQDTISQIHDQDNSSTSSPSISNEVIIRAVIQRSKIDLPAESKIISKILERIVNQEKADHLIDENGNVDEVLLSQFFDQKTLLPNNATVDDTPKELTNTSDNEIENANSHSNSETSSPFIESMEYQNISDSLPQTELYEQLNERQKKQTIKKFHDEVLNLKNTNKELYNLLFQNLNKPISVSEYASQIIPNHPNLVQKIIAENPESIPARELLAKCLFEKILHEQTNKIEQDIQADNYGNAETEEERNAQITETHELLVEMQIREKSESDTEAPTGITLEDYRNINRKLNSFETLEERTAYLDLFLAQMAEITGRSVSAQREIFYRHISEIQGLDTLRTTIENLEADGKLGEIITEEGVNEELFSEYYDTAFEAVSSDYDAVTEYVAEKRIEEKREMERLNALPVSTEVIPIDELRNDPQVAELIEHNGALGNFINPEAEARLLTLPDNSQLLEVTMDTENRDHSLVATLPLDSGNFAKIAIGDEVLFAPKDDHNNFVESSQTLQADYIARKSGLSGLFPFTAPHIDRNHSSEQNDPLQMVKAMQGESFFQNEFALIDETILKTNKKVVELAFGDDFSELTTNTQRKRVRKIETEFGVEFIDSDNELTPSANLFLADVFEVFRTAERHLLDRVDKHDELMAFLKSLPRLGERVERWRDEGKK